MDRPIVYPTALPQDVDLLNLAKFGMLSEAYQNFSILGTSTVVSGLACTPTSPASMVVNIGVGAIFSVDPTDATPYGSLGVDNSSIVKMGVNSVAQSLGPITPPGTTGFSQVFLVQAILNDVDSGPMVLSYYNSSNPQQPFSGPNNTGSSQFTQRLCKCSIALKAGVPATTGTQATPSPDSGYIGLYAITVANGATQITSGNIVQLTSAPFFPTLPAVPPGVQNGTWLWGIDTGSANAYAVTVAYPVPVAYVAGMTIRFKAANANSGASTVNLNGLGNVAIKRATGASLLTGDIASGQVIELTYDGVNFQMTNYLGISAGSTSNNFTSVGIPYVNDTGAQNALVGTYSPAITSGQQIAGLFLAIKLANAITGACTINVNGLGAKNLTLGDGTNPPYNVFTTGMILLLVYDGTEYQVVGTSQGMFAKKPTGNYTIYVNTSTGSDSLYDGTAATVGTGTSGPFKTIQKAITSAYSYAPSQFTITVQVAAGTYNENVATPAYAGPNVIVNGVSAASVIVNGGSGDCFTLSGPNTMTTQNLTVQNNGVYPNRGFLCQDGATLTTSNTASNTCAIVFEASQSGTIVKGNHTFNGSVYSAYWGIFGGTVNLSGVDTISAPISASYNFAVATGGGFINVGTFSYVNASFVSGTKWIASINGVIAFPGGNDGTNGLKGFFPGTIGGNQVTGGQYSG